MVKELEFKKRYTKDYMLKVSKFYENTFRYLLLKHGVKYRRFPYLTGEDANSLSLWDVIRTEHDLETDFMLIYDERNY